VAIVGSGPSGFYAAERLQQTEGLEVGIDMFERLPTPYGLVRSGVAPDHQKIKSVTKQYEAVAAQENFRFFGGVEFGTHLTRDDLSGHYDAVVYAVGTATANPLGIPGEGLVGSHAATEFVAWYNGHLDHTTHIFDLTCKRAVVVGNGNVAADVTRMLARPLEQLAKTDMADHALVYMLASQIEEVVIMGRRGPAQAAFTPPELKELGELEGVDIVVPPEDMELDADSEAQLAEASKPQKRVMELLREYADRPLTGAKRRIVLRFLVSPLEIHGDERVEAISVARNRLELDGTGTLRAVQTDERETLEAGLVLRAVGYRGKPLPGVPFDDRTGTIPNELGRLVETESRKPIPGEYVVGWIKRGPSGVIGTNRADSRETVTQLLEDLDAGLLGHETPGREPDAVDRLLAERAADPFTFEHWQTIDEHEVKAGALTDRPRVKLTSEKAMRDVASSRQNEG
jgi:ferredoxin--NADP+ reductase